MNTPIKFELAKLLKEKGFDKRTSCYYKKDMSFSSQEGYLNGREFNAPTIIETVIWLYENHYIWVVVNFANKNQWFFDCNKFNYSGKEKTLYKSNYDYNSPTEAYEAAIEYTLNNLI